MKIQPTGTKTRKVPGGVRRYKVPHGSRHLTQAQALEAARLVARAMGGGAIAVHNSHGKVVHTIPVAGPSTPVSRPRYAMEIAWSDEDNAYLVTVPDLPGCVTHGATYIDAARMGEEAIALWLEGARHWGRPIPLPGSSAQTAR